MDAATTFVAYASQPLLLFLNNCWRRRLYSCCCCWWWSWCRDTNGPNPPPPLLLSFFLSLSLSFLSCVLDTAQDPVKRASSSRPVGPPPVCWVRARTMDHRIKHRSWSDTRTDTPDPVMIDPHRPVSWDRPPVCWVYKDDGPPSFGLSRCRTGYEPYFRARPVVVSGIE